MCAMQYALVCNAICFVYAMQYAMVCNMNVLHVQRNMLWYENQCSYVPCDMLWCENACLYVL